MKSITIVASVFALLASAMTSQAEPIGVAGASKLPIIDTHFHAMPYMTADDLKVRMEKHNILYIGGAQYAGHFKKNWAFAEEMGGRYIQAEGTSQMNAAFKKGGKEALENADHPVFKKYIGFIRRPIEAGNVRSVAEIFVNARSSAHEEWRRWKIKANSSAMRALFDLASDNGIPMMVHAQLDDDTAEQLVQLAATRPDGKLVLGHCGKDSTATEVRAVFDKAANISCNLAYRSPPQETHSDADRIVWNSNGIKGAWQTLIEDFPDRFMVGIDDTHDWDQFDAVAKTIRDDLLANLTAATAAKVAHENARRIYGL